MTSTHDETAPGPSLPSAPAGRPGPSAATVHACVYLTDRRGRAVQLHPTRGERMWRLPGSTPQPGEDPLQAAVRGTYEQTGLRLAAPLPLLSVHYVPSGARQGPAAAPAGVGLCFDGGTLTDEGLAGIRLDPHGYDRWAAESWEAWERLLGPVGYRRLAAAAEARRTGRTELVVGEPPADG